jgi:SAM-dependent methyltransferase
MHRALGRVLGLSSRLRARAFFHLVDELIPRWPHRLRALEVGCGAGALLVKLDMAGWEVDGLEWDTVVAGVARARSGRPVYEGDFFETELPTGEYQLVVLSHVFEHLENPVAALRRIKELLAPGGRGVLFYPNPESVGARAFGDAWAPWDAPRHLVLPPLRSLAKAAERVGLKPLKWSTRTGRSAARFARTGALETSPLLDISMAGRATAAVARALTALGWGVGEEAIIVLQKCSE